MSNVVVWFFLMVFWIATSIYYVKRDKPTFWPCWAFFFVGWTSMAFFEALFRSFGWIP